MSGYLEPEGPAAYRSFWNKGGVLRLSVNACVGVILMFYSVCCISLVLYLHGFFCMPSRSGQLRASNKRVTVQELSRATGRNKMEFTVGFQGRPGISIDP